MRIGLGTGSSRDRGQASKVPAMPAGTTGTPARDTRTAMPDLSGASLPSRLRVPSGKSVTIPPLRNRRRVSFIPDTPIPSRWMGNPPTERIKNPRTGTNRVDRATKLSGRRNGIPSRRTSRKLRWLATRRTAPLAGMLCRPEARQPPRAAIRVASMYCANRYQSSSPHRRSAPVPARSGKPPVRSRQKRLRKRGQKLARCTSKGKSLLVRRGDASDKLLDHLVDAHAAGVDQHGVCGRFQGGDGPGDVAGVTKAQVLEHGLEAEGLAGCL